MSITDIDRQEIPPIKLSLGLKCVVLLMLLLSFSIPSIADKKILQLPLGGVSVDFSYYQIFLLINVIWIVFTKRELTLGRIERVLILLFCFIIPYNMVAILTTDSSLVVTSLRGIFNFGVNVLCAFWIGYIIKRWMSAELFSLVLVFFGVVIALSSLAEFSLLKFSPNLLEKWRSIVWGEIIEPVELLHAGGVILNPDGMARVGGLIGAPENLGMIMALTLPFAILSRVSLLGHIGIGSLYTLVAIVSSTRMLGIALIIYIVMVLRKFKVNIILKFISLFIICAIIIGIIISGINDESYSRFTMEAFLYELSWRGGILLSFLEATKINKLTPLIGAGLGQFEKDGDYEVIALVGSGILGGDIVVAYGLGGIGGILILSVFWITIWKMRNRSRGSLKDLYLANSLFIMLLILRSLFMPVLMIFVLVSNILTFMSIAFLILLSDMIRKQKSEELDNGLMR